MSTRTWLGLAGGMAAGYGVWRWSQRRAEQRALCHQPGGHRIVILGAGFGGLNAALSLCRHLRDGPAADVLLVDRTNFHLFTPILYQVATGLVEPGNIIYPVRSIARDYGFRFRESEVQEFDLTNRRLISDDGPIPYDTLVIAAGSITNFFGNRSAAERSLTLKTLGDAVTIRNQLVSAFEQADVETDPQRRREWLTFVIVGGGATGVELAGSMATLVRLGLLDVYPNLRPEDIRIVIVEATSRLVPGLDEDLARTAHQRLAQWGVEIRLGTPVVEVAPSRVQLGDGTEIPTRTVIWTAGVRASPLTEWLPVERSRDGRIVIDQMLRVPGLPGVWAIGDAAALTLPGEPRPLPPNAAVAVRQGRHVGRNIAAVLRGQEPQPFFYRPLGELIALGRGAAVADVKNVKFDGFLAWLVWRTFYLWQLMGIRNRLGVLLDWLWGHFERRETARLDVRPARESVERRAGAGAGRAAS